MFWALTIENGRKYTQKIEKGFHVSMAALEHTPGGKKGDNISVMVEHDKSEYLLCSLHSKHLQQPLDHVFEAGDEIAFFLNGNGIVHLTGYHIGDELDDMDEQDSDDEEDEAPTLEPAKFVSKEKYNQLTKAKKQEVNNNLSGQKRKQDGQQSSPAKKGKKDDDDSEDSDDSDFLAGEASEDDSDSPDDDSDSEDEEQLREAVKKLMAGSKPTEKPSNKQNQNNNLQQKNKTPNQQGKNTPNQQGKNTPNQQGKNTPNQQVKTPNQQGGNQQKGGKNQNQTPAQLNSSNQQGNQQDQSSKKKKKKRRKSKGDLNSSVDTPATTPQAKGNAPTPGKTSQGNVTTPGKPSPGNAPSPGKPTAEKKTLPSGTIVEDVRVGSGPEARNGRNVHVYYTGRLHKGGKEFDKIVDGKPFQFKLGKNEVVRGWEDGLQGMKVGGRRKIVIPPSQGYGGKQTGPIPPNSTLVFDIELKAVN